MHESNEPEIIVLINSNLWGTKLKEPAILHGKELKGSWIQCWALFLEQERFPLLTTGVESEQNYSQGWSTVQSSVKGLCIQGW